MKKIFLFAIAAVGMTVGCQKIQDILVNPNENPVDPNSSVEIKFTTNVANVETKANGPVESFDAKKHTLYVYGLNTTAGIEAGTDKKEIINAPATIGVGTNLKLDKKYFYKGTTDTYDFYGYYVDDAAVVTPNVATTDYKLNVTITGQQDILLAKALGKDALKDDVAVSGAYSAKTARANVHPNLEFQHQLSQFAFNVRNCGSYKIILKGAALNAVNEGVLTVAGADQGLDVGTATADLTVSEKYQTLDKVTKNEVYKKTEPEYNFTSVGNPVMVFPKSAYSVVLYLWQEGMDEGMVRKVTVPVKITNEQKVLEDLELDEDPGALDGYAYDLNITVYSLEEITITASLVPWKNGQSFQFDTEKDDVVGENDSETTWTFSIDPSEKAVAVEGETFDVTATQIATVAIPDAAKSWITVTADQNVYTFTVTKNEGTTARTAEVTFTVGKDANKQTKTLKVTQAAPFTIDPATKTVTYEGGTFTVTPSKVATVTVPTEATWIAYENKEGVHTFTVAQYDNFAVDRTAEVTFTSGEETCKLTVTQTYNPNV